MQAGMERYLLFLQADAGKVGVARDLLGAHRDFLTVGRHTCELKKLADAPHSQASTIASTFKFNTKNVCTWDLNASAGASSWTWTSYFCFCHFTLIETVAMIYSILSCSLCCVLRC